MRIPKEIVDKMKQVNSLTDEIDKWLDENIDLDGSKHDHRQWMTGDYKHPDWYEFTDEVSGEEQDDGEYCNQWPVGESGDSFDGYYYYPTDTGEYFYFQYSV